MEKAKEVLKMALKAALKLPFKIILIVLILVVGVLIILLPAATYFITVDDGTYKEDDWSSTPYAASTYVNGTKVESDGTISTATSAQDLWDRMIANGNDVDKYLDSPEELARIMKAEMVTQYPDTRPNPDEEIDWEAIFEDADAFQGIIKFKRADTNGNRSTMSYVDPQTFQSWIDEYNKSGSETAKQNALSHFTLKKAGASSSLGVNYSGPLLVWPVDSTTITSYFGLRDAPIAGASTNHGAVDIGINVGDNVYACEAGTVTVASYQGNAGNMVTIDHGNGYTSTYMHNDSIVVSVGDTVTKGQVIALGGNTGNSTGPHCHFQIEFNGTKIDPLSFKYTNGMGDGTGGFGIDTSEEEEEDTENTDEDKEDEDTGTRAQETDVIGDGYSKEYTSSSGITYKLYRQFEGSYANNSYWNGTMHDSGCGPTAVAILASGLTGYDYTPADIANQMGGEGGYTSYTTLKAEMDTLGMTSEIITGPTAEDIQENLKNGKVMLVSVNNNTIFTNNSHIMAIIDINTDGQVYIGNPGSSSLYGWYDIDEIMKGCQYIITTDSNATGVANSSNDSSYVAVVATWKQTDTSVTSDDPTVEQKSTTEYSMTTTDINYEEMVDPYTMPFDMLWALLVVGEDKNFIFELADLIYNSDIEITVHDNLTVNTDVDEWHYTQRTRTVVNGTISAEVLSTYRDSQSITNHIDDPYSESSYITTKTVVTQTNTITTALTRANVWIVDYQNEYEYVGATETTNTNKITQPDQDYPASPNKIENNFSCEHIAAIGEELLAGLKLQALQDHPETIDIPAGSWKLEDARVEYYYKYINIYDNVTNTVSTQKYVSGTPTLKEKTDKKSEEPNFVTIFNKGKYRRNKSAIKDASSWLFEIIELNESTADMLDLIKYLLYKATGIDYGVTEFDFSIFYPGGLITAGEGDYIVDTTKSPSNIVIKDLNKLKQAFSGYSNDRVLQQYAYYFLECQERYNVNAVFAAAVSITESSAGTNLAIGGNNIFSISNGGAGNWNSYATMEDSIEAFFRLISGEYFGNGQYLVSSIANGNPPGSHMYCIPPENWIKNTVTYMTQMFNAAGINPTSSDSTTANGNKIVEVAKSKLGSAYKYGAAGPNQFDCSGFTQWCYKQVGISIPHNTEEQFKKATKKVPVSEARVGDILYKKGHVGIYIGNGEFIHAPHTGDVVKISKVNGYGFKNALQFN